MNDMPIEPLQDSNINFPFAKGLVWAFGKRFAAPFPSDGVALSPWEGIKQLDVFRAIRSRPVHEQKAEIMLLMLNLCLAHTDVGASCEEIRNPVEFLKAG